MEKAIELSKKIVDVVENHQNKYVSDAGKDIPSEYYIESLNDIVQKTFVLYQYIVEKKLFQDDPQVLSTCVELNKLADSLAISKTNAEKLTISSAIELWNKVKVAGALLACTILDIADEKESG